jgi:hypothetical protein
LLHADFATSESGVLISGLSHTVENGFIAGLENQDAFAASLFNFKSVSEAVFLPRLFDQR